MKLHGTGCGRSFVATERKGWWRSSVVYMNDHEFIIFVSARSTVPDFAEHQPWHVRQRHPAVSLSPLLSRFLQIHIAPSEPCHTPSKDNRISRRWFSWGIASCAHLYMSKIVQKSRSSHVIEWCTIFSINLETDHETMTDHRPSFRLFTSPRLPLDTPEAVLRNVERMIKANMGKPGQQEKALGRFIASLSQDDIYVLRRQIYQKLLGCCH